MSERENSFEVQNSFQQKNVESVSLPALNNLEKNEYSEAVMVSAENTETDTRRQIAEIRNSFGLPDPKQETAGAFESEKRVEFAHKKRLNELNEQVRSVANKLVDFRNFLARSRTYEQSEYETSRFSFLQQFNPDDLNRLGYLLGRTNLDSKGDVPYGRLEKKMQEYAEQNPDLYYIYQSIVGDIIRSDHNYAKQKLESFREGKEVNLELRRELEKRTIALGRDMTPEQISMLQENFPTGNYLLHTTGVDELGEIVNSGEILSAHEISKKRKKFWGRGGKEGISFNMNNVRVLTGDEKHFVGFVVSPEAVLHDTNKLVVPYHAAQYEMQLVSRNYKNILHVSDESEIDYAAPLDVLDYDDSELPRVAIEDTFVFCNEVDVNEIRNLLATETKLPKGIFTYPASSLRVESWIQPLGDHEVVDRLFDNAFQQSGLKPSLDWERDILGDVPEIKYGVFVEKSFVEHSKTVVKTEKGLEVV